MKTLADDSGLEVKALNGRPGIHSARYGASDADRVGRLLRELEGRAGERQGRGLQGIPCLLSARRRANIHILWQRQGCIGFEARGEKGFGFDPVFMLPEMGKSLAELNMDEKNKISHRGQALAAFRAFINI